MTDIREEFARKAESRRKPPISGSNIGYNCAIDEMAADLRALPSVCGGGVTDAMIAALLDLEMEGGRLKNDHRHLVAKWTPHISAMFAASPPPVSAREEVLRNAIAAMEPFVARADHFVLSERHDTYTVGVPLGALRKLVLSLAALKREVG